MNPLPDNPLDLAILLYKSLQGRTVAEGHLCGKVGQEFDFSELTAHLEKTDILMSANLAQRSIECQIPNGFFLSLQDLLTAPVRRITPPSRFYLVDSDFLYEGADGHHAPAIQQYLAVTKLYELLGRVADHHGGVGSAKTLIFLQKTKIEITSEYTETDLRDLPGLVEFQTEFIDSEAHKEQKATIIKSALLELFAGQTRVSFAALLGRFGDFADKVKAGYQLYVSEFSFQKVKNEVEKEKLDALVKLNKVFSDIQNQLLAVPVALVLAGGQMEAKGNWGIKNILIWLGALVFAIFMDLLIRNQRHTLRAVKQEIDQQRQQIEEKYRPIADRFKDSYKEVAARHIHQQRLIWVVELLVAIALAVPTVLLLWFSNAVPPLLEALRQFQP